MGSARKILKNVKMSQITCGAQYLNQGQELLQLCNMADRRSP